MRSRVPSRPAVRQFLPVAGSPDSVEPLVGGVEFRQADDEDLHFADGSMPGAGSDHDGHPDADGNAFAVELHGGIRTAFEKDVRFSEALVVVRLSVDRDRRLMNRAREVRHVGEGPSGSSTGTRDAGDRIKVGEFVAGGC